MIHNKVHAEADPFLVTFLCQMRKIIHRSKLRLHLPEIRYRISAVRPPFRRIQKRHQVHVVYIAFFQIIKFFFHAPDISRKIVDIHHHAEHILLTVPCACLHAF